MCGNKCNDVAVAHGWLAGWLEWSLGTEAGRQAQASRQAGTGRQGKARKEGREKKDAREAATARRSDLGRAPTNQLEAPGRSLCMYALSLTSLLRSLILHDQARPDQQTHLASPVRPLPHLASPKLTQTLHGSSQHIPPPTSPHLIAWPSFQFSSPFLTSSYCTALISFQHIPHHIILPNIFFFFFNCQHTLRFTPHSSCQQAPNASLGTRLHDRGQ